MTQHRTLCWHRDRSAASSSDSAFAVHPAFALRRAPAVEGQGQGLLCSAFLWYEVDVMEPRLRRRQAVPAASVVVRPASITENAATKRARVRRVLCQAAATETPPRRERVGGTWTDWEPVPDLLKLRRRGQGHAQFHELFYRTHVAFQDTLDLPRDLLPFVELEETSRVSCGQGLGVHAVAPRTARKLEQLVCAVDDFKRLLPSESRHPFAEAMSIRLERGGASQKAFVLDTKCLTDRVSIVFRLAQTTCDTTSCT